MPDDSGPGNLSSGLNVDLEQLASTAAEAEKQLRTDMEVGLQPFASRAIAAEQNVGNIAAQFEEINRRKRREEELREKRAENTANATVKMAELMAIMSKAIQQESLKRDEESSKRDKADVRNMIIAMAGVVIMLITLVVTLLK